MSRCDSLIFRSRNFILPYMRKVLIFTGILLAITPSHADEEQPESDISLKAPLGLPKPKIPAGNPLTRPKIELGRLLFFDKRLSRDKTISCASCHNPRTGYADARPTARGIRRRCSTPPIRTPSSGTAAWQVDRLHEEN